MSIGLKAFDHWQGTAVTKWWRFMVSSVFIAKSGDRTVQSLAAVWYSLSCFIFAVGDHLYFVEI